MKINLKSTLKISALTLAFCGIMVSTISAQTKPAQKSAKKDSVKKEAAVKVVKKEQKPAPAPAAKKH